MATPEAAGGVGLSAAAMYPDAFVSDAGRPGRSGGWHGGPGVAVLPPPLRMPTVVPKAIPHVTVEIHDTAGRRLVTAIEVLVADQQAGGDGREE